MPEESDADDDVSSESQALLRLKVLLFEARTAAKGYYRVFSYHDVKVHYFTETSQVNYLSASGVIL
jgi:hypothetical protein